MSLTALLIQANASKEKASRLFQSALSAQEGCSHFQKLCKQRWITTSTLPQLFSSPPDSLCGIEVLAESENVGECGVSFSSNVGTEGNAGGIPCRNTTCALQRRASKAQRRSRIRVAKCEGLGQEGFGDLSRSLSTILSQKQETISPRRRKKGGTEFLESLGIELLLGGAENLSPGQR
jgi:hypothetical protein